MPVIETVGIFSKPNIPGAAEIVAGLLSWLSERGIATRIDEQTANYSGRADALDRQELVRGCQLLIVLGGDGTLLAAARAVAGTEVAVLGVNLGNLGFLTTTTLDALYPELEQTLAGEFRLGHRRMLDGELRRDGQTIAQYQALNDVVFAKAALARIITVDAWADEQFICRYKADGLIVSTPTGSTAYSLSAGGPIIFPTVEALCLAPICPHMLTMRPVLVPGTATIRVDIVDQDDSQYLTVDGQVGEPLRRGDQIFCRISKTKINLIRPPQQRFFDVLRAKLKWGER